MSTTSRASASPTASGTLGVITWKEMSEVKPSAGRLARVASCWATRTSLARAEMRDADPDRPARQQRREQELGEDLRRVPDDGADRVGGAEPDGDGEDARRSRRRPRPRARTPPTPSRAGAPPADRRGQERLERPLVALADDRVGGDHRRDHRAARPAAAASITPTARWTSAPVAEAGMRKRVIDRSDEEDERQHRHRGDDEAVAPELAQLLAHDGADALRLIAAPRRRRRSARGRRPRASAGPRRSRARRRRRRRARASPPGAAARGSETVST